MTIPRRKSNVLGWLLVVLVILIRQGCAFPVSPDVESSPLASDGELSPDERNRRNIYLEIGDDSSSFIRPSPPRISLNNPFLDTDQNMVNSYYNHPPKYGRLRYHGPLFDADLPIETGSVGLDGGFPEQLLSKMGGGLVHVVSKEGRAQLASSRDKEKSWGDEFPGLTTTERSMMVGSVPTLVIVGGGGGEGDSGEKTPSPGESSDDVLSSFVNSAVTSAVADSILAAVEDKAKQITTTPMENDEVRILTTTPPTPPTDDVVTSTSAPPPPPPPPVETVKKIEEEMSPVPESKPISVIVQEEKIEIAAKHEDNPPPPPSKAVSEDKPKEKVASKAVSEDKPKVVIESKSDKGKSSKLTNPHFDYLDSGPNAPLVHPEDYDDLTSGEIPLLPQEAEEAEERKKAAKKKDRLTNPQVDYLDSGPNAPLIHPEGGFGEEEEDFGEEEEEDFGEEEEEDFGEEEEEDFGEEEEEDFGEEEEEDFGEEEEEDFGEEEEEDFGEGEEDDFGEEDGPESEEEEEHSGISKYRAGELIAIPPGFESHNPTGPDYEYLDDVGISGPLISPKEEGKSTGRGFIKKKKDNKVSKYRKDEVVAVPPGYPTHNPSGPDYEYVTDAGISGPLISPKKPGQSTGRSFSKKAKEKASKYRTGEVVAIPPGYPTHNPSGPDYDYVTDVGISGPLIPPKKSGQSTGRSFSKKVKEKASKYRKGEVIAVPPGYPTHNPTGPDYDYVTDAGISGPLKSPKKPGQSTGRSFSKKSKASKYRAGEVVAIPPGYPTHNPTGPDYEYDTDVGISGPLIPGRKPTSTGRGMQGSESKYRPGEVVAIPPGYETHDPTGPNYEYHDDVGVSGPLIHPPGAELEAPPPSPSAPLISLKPKSPTNPNGRSILKSSHPASSPVITLEKPSSGENAVPAPTPIHKSGGIVANVFQKMETTPADEDEDLPDFDYEDDTEIKTPAPTIRIKNKLGGEPKHIFEVFDEVYSSTLLSIATTTWGGRENDDLTFPSSASSSASVESESYEYDEEFYRVFDYALSPNGEYEYDEEYDYSSSSSSSESREFRARGDDYDSSFEEYFDDEEEEESSSEEEDEISPKTRKYSSASDSGWGYASASKKEGGSRRTDFNVGELQPPPAAGRRRANYYIRA